MASCRYGGDSEQRPTNAEAEYEIYRATARVRREQIEQSLTSNKLQDRITKIDRR